MLIDSGSVNRLTLLSELIDLASGPFSYVSQGVRLTWDSRRFYNKLILARDWQDDIFAKNIHVFPLA